MNSLRDQHVTNASPATKTRLSILSTALVDALGGPAEFRRRFSFPLITTMIPNTTFSLPPGAWTDDTSMTLCLAHSLATFSPSKGAGAGGFDENHQLATYLRWRQDGFLSVTDDCFDVGNTIGRALLIYAQSLRLSSPDEGRRLIIEQLSDDSCAGNGSLMRIAPIGLAYWRDEETARRYARQSSQTTHPTHMCLEACEMWTGAIVRIVQASNIAAPSKFTKLDLVEYISAFPYTDIQLREALAVSSDAPRPNSADGLEKYYRAHHPIMKLVAKMEDEKKTPPVLPSAQQLPSTGFVLHTLVAALYCFFSTSTFEAGIMAVNLGNDADTVGAVYGGLAGCWYGGEKQGKNDRFWSTRVEEWSAALMRKEVVEQAADALVVYSEKLGK